MSLRMIALRYGDIPKVIAPEIEARAEAAKIETTVLCADLQEWCNRSLGQIRRQSDARFARTRAACGMGE